MSACYAVGLSAFYHDSAAVLMRDGQVVAAAQEERLTRVKHDSRFPTEALRWVLEQAPIDRSGIVVVGYYEKPQLKLKRQLDGLGMALAGATPDRIARLDPNRPFEAIRDAAGIDCEIVVSGHHESHAASAYCCSGFPNAAILTVDGVGEWDTACIGVADSSGLRLETVGRFPNSLGLLYSTVTAYLGFAVNDGEYKVMGLAPYGSSKHLADLAALVEVRDDGTISLDQRFFDFGDVARPYNEELTRTLGFPPRKRGEQLEPHHADLASSVQCVLNDAMLKLARIARERSGSRYLCMAGGVALNCVANSVIRREAGFDEVFVQPAAGDAGTAIGAAALATLSKTGRLTASRIDSVYWGPSFENESILRLLGEARIEHTVFSSLRHVAREVAALLADGEIVAWFQGAMEFGPRALGNRSILADARRPDMKDRINAAIKKREGFRPFAPVVIAEDAERYFALNGSDSPFMIFTCDTVVDNLPAVTHVDRSARVQTVRHDQNAPLYELLCAFRARTGCSVLLNTSFNVKDEPIVATPEDALSCFVRSGADAVVLGTALVRRSGVPEAWSRWLSGWRAATDGTPSENVYTFF